MWGLYVRLRVIGRGGRQTGHGRHRHLRKYYGLGGTQLVGEYIGPKKVTVAQWVDLHLLLEVCAQDTGYEGGGRKI